MQNRASNVAPVFTDEALACARAAGLSPRALLAEIGAGGTDLDFVQFGALWRRIAAGMGCEFFGLGARPMPVGSFAMLAHIARGEPDLERSIRRGLAFLALILGAPSGALTLRDGRAVITLHDPRTGPHRAFAHRTFWILIHALSCWLVRRRIPLLTVDFACPAPYHRADYGQFFGAPTRFDQPASALSFDARHLRLPVTRSEADLRAFLRASPANILTGYTHDARIIGQVRALLLALDPVDWPDFPALALRLGTPQTTLRRELRREGASYRELKDQIRFARAEKFLRRGDLTVTQIASSLGYAEPSAFYRAFKAKHGITPDQFRRTAVPIKRDL